MTVTIHWRDAHTIVGHAGPMIMGVVADADPNRDGRDVDHSSECIRERLEHHSTVAYLLAIEHGVPTPTFEERRRMRDTLAEFGDRVVIGYAFCGLGFWANTLRVVLTGISRLAGTPLIAHGTVQATAEAIARELVGIDADELSRLTEQLRSELREGHSLSAVG